MVSIKGIAIAGSLAFFITLAWMLKWYHELHSPVGVPKWHQKYYPLAINFTTSKTSKRCLNLGDILSSYSNINHSWNPEPETFLNSRLPTQKVSISVLKSQFILKQERDLLHMVFTARDSSGKQQTQGGNFFFATLSDSKMEKWTAGKVIDYDNGTYSIYFYVGWGGDVYINVTLVNPREDVLWTKYVYRPSVGRAMFAGIFHNSIEKPDGKGICIVQRSEGTWENKCEYRNENSFGKSLIICEKPQGFICKDLKYFTANQNAIQPLLKAKQISSKITHFLSNNSIGELNEFGFFQIPVKKKSIYMVPLVQQFFAILKENHTLNKSAGTIENSQLKVGSAECLPKCGPGLPEPVSDGYWSNSIWNSLVCNSKQWTNQKEIFLCLKNKNIYFIGDSTLRQWYEGLVNLFGYTENFKELGDRFYCHYFNKLYNISATFHMHFWFGTLLIYPLEKTRYIADFVDSLSDSTCNYIIFITASFHFPEWTRESYGEMLEKTKEAVDRLLERCPISIVVVKGSHPRGDLNENWILHDMNLHLRQIFAKDPRIIFINVWDIDLSFPYSQAIHMPKFVITQELFLVFSHMCS